MLQDKGLLALAIDVHWQGGHMYVPNGPLVLFHAALSSSTSSWEGTAP